MHADFPLGNNHLPLAKLGLRKQNNFYRNRHASMSYNLLGFLVRFLGEQNIEDVF